MQEELRVAEALAGLPTLERALASGEISWSAVRELTRVAVRETEHEWLEFVQGKTLRQLEQVLAGTRSGDTPASPPDLVARGTYYASGISVVTRPEGGHCERLRVAPATRRPAPPCSLAPPLVEPA
jgi:hypothetical protein